MAVAGIDLGGTKSEVRVFDQTWAEIARRRDPTPQDYPALLALLKDQVDWAEAQVGHLLPVGLGTAGRFVPESGRGFAANLPITGHPFAEDLAQAIGRSVTCLNDGSAMALSEAVFGAGCGHKTVMSVILGTGIGGALVVDQSLIAGPTHTAGEIGHTAAPAHVVQRYKLPITRCGCGRMGCYETYITGPGLTALAAHCTGHGLPPDAIAARRTKDMAEVWEIWCALTAELLHSLTVTVDPDVIVLGGGLTRIDGVLADLRRAAQAAQIGPFPSAPLALAQGGDSSGARGAAFAAWQELQA